MAARWTPPRHLSDPKLRQVFSSLSETLGESGELFDEFESLLSPKLMLHVHWRSTSMSVPHLNSINDYVNITPTAGDYVRGGGDEWLTISGAAFTVHETGVFRVALTADFNAAPSTIIGAYSVNNNTPLGLFTGPNTLVGATGYGERVQRLDAGDVVRFKVAQTSGSSQVVARAQMSIERMA